MRKTERSQNCVAWEFLLGNFVLLSTFFSLVFQKNVISDCLPDKMKMCRLNLISEEHKTTDLSLITMAESAKKINFRYIYSGTYIPVHIFHIQNALLVIKARFYL